ncbi:hypothetical protein RFI_26718 [Reticulomyxa filosa]|uniref:ceramidase n=1 Tax=Reticulomyxa filosa TaxID=46433 RepID=X6M9T2_RETFI|nr:hypothetical protein RFI_26718 [Reticulomyxa filosa]|eukprot:ETO10659.1 hypothetical protein RFI_26718 [Reticulomyxa filosa]
MMQLIYEAMALCTSIVTIDRKNKSKPIHIRTMDWGIKFLQPLTIEIQFTLQNQVICYCTTWAGYIGILTGLHFSRSKFSKSIECDSDSALSGSWLIGFKLRDLLITPHQYQLFKFVKIKLRYQLKSNLEHCFLFYLFNFLKNPRIKFVKKKECDIDESEYFSFLKVPP